MFFVFVFFPLNVFFSLKISPSSEKFIEWQREIAQRFQGNLWSNRIQTHPTCVKLRDIICMSCWKAVGSACTRAPVSSQFSVWGPDGSEVDNTSKVLNPKNTIQGGPLLVTNGVMGPLQIDIING